MGSEMCIRDRSKIECLEVAHGLHLDESTVEAALIYLDELSLIFYYPEILPNLVFTNPQVLLDKVSELVKVYHMTRSVLGQGMKLGRSSLIML